MDSQPDDIETLKAEVAVARARMAEDAATIAQQKLEGYNGDSPSLSSGVSIASLNFNAPPHSLQAMPGRIAGTR